MKNNGHSNSMWKGAPAWVSLLILIIGALSVSFSPVDTSAPVPPPADPGDSIQVLLYELHEEHPEMVDYIPETQRLYLNYKHHRKLSDEFILRLQDAFYYDIAEVCRVYGWKYLVDWRVLASKCARETFWGTSYLCNRTHNYFGIWRSNKDWICSSFGKCDTYARNDPSPAEFAVFPDFETSLWMFIHVMYSQHFMVRLPDNGARVAEAIRFELDLGCHYWDVCRYNTTFPTDQLPGEPYTAEEVIKTWSEHEGYNLCVDCTRKSDHAWVSKFDLVASRAMD